MLPQPSSTVFNFYPRSPCGERHLGAWKSCNVCYFYPRSPCGERPTKSGQATSNHQISIHALLAESDCYSLRHSTPRWRFLSTLSLRRATESENPIVAYDNDFYPRSPCGERPVNGQNIKRRHKISIHALLAESDLAPEENPTQKRISIHALLAESDNGRPEIRQRGVISIHALLAESDASQGV